MHGKLGLPRHPTKPLGVGTRGVDTPGKSWIVSVLQEELELRDVPEPEGLKAALAERLKQGFADSIWSGEEKDDEYEEW